MTEGARRAAHRLAWSVIVLFIISIVIGTGNLLFTTDQVHRLQSASRSLEKQLHADCGWYGHIASLPVTVPPGAKRPTVLSVRLISDSRVAWHARGCPGPVPPPDPSLVKWAAYYHLPIG